MFALIAVATLAQVSSSDLDTAVTRWAPIPNHVPATVVSGLKAYALFAERGRPTQLGWVTDELKELRKRIPASGPPRTARLTAISTAENKLRLLKAGVTFPIPLIYGDERVLTGQVGVLHSEVKVLTVVGGKAGHLLVKFGKREVILSGIDTTSYVDGDTVSIATCMECVGPQSFGGQTLLEFRPFQHQKALDEWVGLRTFAYAEWPGLDPK